MIIPRQVIILTVLAVALNLIRVIWSDSTYFIYLLWNIFLAFLPFLLSNILLWYKINKKINLEFLVFGLIVWLFLFPNAPYLVTDFIHLGVKSIVPLWYDALLIFSSAWLGMLLALYSLSNIERLFLTRYSKRVTSFIIIVFILISSFGIYIGRFLRWNTWDVIIQPKHIIHDVSVILLHPFHYIEAYTFTISFFVFIYVSYISWKSTKS
jgi:uncharacterized membrane protein